MGTAAGAAMPEEVCVPIHAEHDIVTARKTGREMAESLGFAGNDLTLIATAISELSRNIVRYAGQGEMLFWSEKATDRGGQGLVVQARDKGPGIPDLGLAMQDGYSTGRGLGLGLPGARRLMDEFDIQSE